MRDKQTRNINVSFLENLCVCLCVFGGRGSLFLVRALLPVVLIKSVLDYISQVARRFSLLFPETKNSLNFKHGSSFVLMFGKLI